MAKTLPIDGPQVIEGPGEMRAVDIGDGLQRFKIESHNHPSFIEPYQGLQRALAVSCAMFLPWAHVLLRF